MNALNATKLHILKWLILLCEFHLKKKKKEKGSSLYCDLERPHRYMVVYALKKSLQEYKRKNIPGGPVVKNLPSNAGDVGSIPGQGT